MDEDCISSLIALRRNTEKKIGISFKIQTKS